MNYYKMPIGLKGTFKINPRMKQILNEHIIYSVSSIRSIKDYIADNINVRNLVFIDQGLTDEDYVECLNNDIPIVTLVTEGNEFYSIPANMFIAVPDSIGKKYINKAVVVNLGYLPEDLNIDYVNEEIEDLIKGKLGIESTSDIKDVSGTYVVTYEEHDEAEKERISNVTDNKTCKGELLKTLETLEKYKTMVKILLKKVEGS